MFLTSNELCSWKSCQVEITVILHLGHEGMYCCLRLSQMNKSAYCLSCTSGRKLCLTCTSHGFLCSKVMPRLTSNHIPYINRDTKCDNIFSIIVPLIAVLWGIFLKYRSDGSGNIKTSFRVDMSSSRTVGGGVGSGLRPIHTGDIPLLAPYAFLKNMFVK